MVTNGKRKSIPIKHLEMAANEVARRYPHRSVEEEEEYENTETSSSSSPFLLVANGVRDNWQVPTGSTTFTVPGS
jgi:hypothetical protein